METPMKYMWKLVFRAQPVQDGTGGVDLLAMNPNPGHIDWKTFSWRLMKDVDPKKHHSPDWRYLHKEVMLAPRQASKTHLQRELPVAPEKKSPWIIFMPHMLQARGEQICHQIFEVLQTNQFRFVALVAYQGPGLYSCHSQTYCEVRAA